MCGRTAMENTSNLKVYVRHLPEEHHLTLQGINFAGLIASFTEEPMRLADVRREDGSYEDGSIKLSVERTHEWELLLGISVAGSKAFVAGVATALGKRVGNWIVEWYEQSSTKE